MTRPATPNDYAVLGLRPGAGQAEIHDAYRRLAKIHHPDRNPGDAAALATFHRLTESYAALRGRAAAAGRATTPLSAAATARRRPASRRATPMTGVADLPVGGSLWVEADAILAGPDRAAALRPSARGSAFPDAARVIRIERRPDGHHVFMPPQPSARWAVGAEAETDGLAVAVLWVGDRQQGAAGSSSAAQLPLRLMTRTVGEMAVKERGWVARDALAVDDRDAWTLDLTEPVCLEPHRATPLRVLRDADGYRVHSDLSAAEWRPTDSAAGARGPVLTAMLAGVAHPARAEGG